MSFHPTDVHVGQRLRQRREQAGWPMKQLAQQLDLSYQQIEKYEEGANRISASRLLEFAQAFDCTPNDFFDGLLGKAGNGHAAATMTDTTAARQRLDLNRCFPQIPGNVRRQFVQLAKAIAVAH